MILSMTGFGRGTAVTPDRKITVEIKSLNSKQLDLYMRIPSLFRQEEIEVRNILTPLIERGKVEMNVVAETIGDTSPVALNVEVMRSYKSQIQDASVALGINLPEDWYSTLMRLPDVMATRQEELAETDREAFRTASIAAAEALTAYRIAEGRKLYDFFVKKIDNIRQLLSEVEPFEKERVPKIRQRLEEHLASLKMVDYDKGRLEQELIFYIEKLDINEEKLRLSTHLSYFMETMGTPEGMRPDAGQGKKLGFIAQEMGREINTLGSKSNNAEMQKIVVMMKDELEQIKEQVLNVL